MGLQAVSAAAPLIIEDRALRAPFEYDEEKILLVSDFYNRTDESMLQGLYADPFVWPGSANQVVVNGKAFDGQDPKLTEPWYIDVDYDRTYYLRYIGAQTTMYYVRQICICAVRSKTAADRRDPSFAGASSRPLLLPTIPSRLSKLKGLTLSH